jgi:hypothetical protein
MRVPQEHEAGIQVFDPLAPLVHGEVFEQVSLGSGVGHAKVLPLPLKPMKRGQRSEKLAIFRTEEASVPGARGQRILPERAHTAAIYIEAQGVVMVAAHQMVAMFGQPTDTLDRARPVIDDVAAKGNGIVVLLSTNDCFQRGPIAVDVRKDQQLRGRFRRANTALSG